MRRLESDERGLLGNQFFYLRIFQFGRCPAIAAQEENAIVLALRMVAGSVCVPAFNFRDKALGNQKSKRTINGGRSDAASASSL